MPEKISLSGISDKFSGDIIYKTFFDFAEFPTMPVNEDTAILLCNNFTIKVYGQGWT